MVTTATARRRRRILVIDDDEALVAALQRCLSEHDNVVTVTARQALALVRGGDRFDLLLTDLMMPDMTGMELHDALVRAVPEQAGRMVFMTGSAGHDPARGFLAALPNRRIDKPFDLGALYRLLDEVAPSFAFAAPARVSAA